MAAIETSISSGPPVRAAVTTSAHRRVRPSTRIKGSLLPAALTMRLGRRWLPGRYRPVPVRHGFVQVGLGTGRREEHGEPAAPLEVARERGPELGVAGQAGLVGGIEQQAHPPAALRLGDPAAEVAA